MTAPSIAADASAQASERHPFKPGDVFEKYQIVNLIGRGGSAFVYHGYQEFLDRHVAIKVIPGKENQSEEFRRRARAEATVLSRLRHPNVVRVFDAGVSEDGAFIYIVMEKLEGRTLREVLYALGVLSVPEALLVGAQICDAVEAAHRLGVIHRDLKPENIFIEAGNHANVLDFGIAKFRGAGFATTAKHRWHGTALYMSPEHLQGKGVSERSDIYALGTMLYESLSGGHPCLNGIESPSIQDIAWIQISHVPPLLTQVVPTIPDYVARIVQRAIAKLPEHRYGSMLELGVALRDAERLLTLACRERRQITPNLRELVSETNTRLGDRLLAVPMAAASPAESPPRSARSPSALSPEHAPASAASASPTASGVDPAAPARGPGNTLRLVASVPQRSPTQVEQPSSPVPSRPEPPSPPPPSVRPRSLRKSDRAPAPRSKIKIVALGCAVGLTIAVPVGIVLGLSDPASTPPTAGASSDSAEPAALSGEATVKAVTGPFASKTQPDAVTAPIAEVNPQPTVPANDVPSPTVPPRTSTPPATASATPPAPPARTKSPAPTTTGLVFPEPLFDDAHGTKERMPKSGL